MARFPTLRRLKNIKGVHETVEVLDKLTPRPQDIAGGIMHQSLYGAWSGVRNATRGIRGEAKAVDFLTGEKTVMSPRQRLANDLRKKRKEFRAGYEIDFDHQTGRHVPRMETDANGNLVPIKVSRREMAGKIVSDAVIGNSAMALGWGAKTTAGLAGYAAMKSVRPLGHAAYQTAGLARDIGIGGAGYLHAMSQNKIGAWGLALAPVGIMAGASAYDAGDHYAVNKGLRAYEGRQVDSTWGSISGDGRFDVDSVGRSEKGQKDVTRGTGQVLDTFGTGGDLVFSMHNQR